MADRYQDRPFPGDDDYDRDGDQHASGRPESDPLAELARLIGQTDPFGSMGRTNQPVPSRPAPRDPYPPLVEADDGPPAGPPPWMQRANRQEVPQQEPEDYPSAVHPLQRLAAARATTEHDYQQEPQYAEEPDPSRYDDALYGQPETEGQPHHDPAYADDGYGYQDDYNEGAEDQGAKRRGGMVTVAVVFALAVLGTGAAFAYRTYVGSPRSGEPPIIKADTNPTKVVPTSADGASKVPDRLAAGDGAEKIVPREEAPVDVNARSGPRVVLPPLNPNPNPPSAMSVSPGGPPPANAGNGTMPNSEPRKVKVLTVRGDQADGTAVPVTPPNSAKQAPTPGAPRTTVAPAPATPRNAGGNAPLSLSPQDTPAAAPEPRQRVAATSPVQTAPAPSSASGGGGYLVQVSSQKNEADAQSSYRVLQGKYPSVLGSQSVLVKRVDLGEKGIYYRAFAGPFSSADQAAQLCNSLKAAGGPQCLIQRN